MSTVETIQGAIELTRMPAADAYPQTSFLGITATAPATMGTRVAIGFGEIAGICKVVSAVPGAVSGTLYIEQSVDGINYDQVNSWPMGPGAVVTFAIKIAGRYVRARFVVPAGETYDIRFGAQLKPLQSP